LKSEKQTRSCLLNRELKSPDACKAPGFLPFMVFKIHAWKDVFYRPSSKTRRLAVVPENAG